MGLRPDSSAGELAVARVLETESALLAFTLPTHHPEGSQRMDHSDGIAKRRKEHRGGGRQRGSDRLGRSQCYVNVPFGVR